MANNRMSPKGMEWQRRIVESTLARTRTGDAAIDRDTAALVKSKMKLAAGENMRFRQPTSEDWSYAEKTLGSTKKSQARADIAWAKRGVNLIKEERRARGWK